MRLVTATKAVLLIAVLCAQLTCLTEADPQGGAQGTKRKCPPGPSQATCEKRRREQGGASSHVDDFVEMNIGDLHDGTLENDLKLSYNKMEDQLYVLMGDTQFWFQCDGSNTECIRATGGVCRNIECGKSQNRWANRAQRSSILALNELIRSKLRKGSRGLHGVVINGDLTDIGSRAQYMKFARTWGRLDNITMYYGLGQGDYSEENAPPSRRGSHHLSMLRFMRDFIKDRDYDGSLRENWVSNQTYNFQGSLAYEWRSCTRSRASCVDFMQLQNYPGYTKTFMESRRRKFQPALYEYWRIQPSYLWLQVRSNVTGHVIMNMHQLDKPSAGGTGRNRLPEILEASKYNVLAIFFSKWDTSNQMRLDWCIKGRHVPLIYTGSVVNNNRYVLLHLKGTTIQTLYSLRVQSDWKTKVEKIKLNTAAC